jgi:hypothetical protein
MPQNSHTKQQLKYSKKKEKRQKSILVPTLLQSAACQTQEMYT